jgi:uncharacterized membrane protein
MYAKWRSFLDQKKMNAPRLDKDEQAAQTRQNLLKDHLDQKDQQRKMAQMTPAEREYIRNCLLFFLGFSLAICIAVLVMVFSLIICFLCM